MTIHENNSIRNLTQTHCHPNCLLCHYSGYSNVCTFFQGGECLYVSFKKTRNNIRSESTMENRT
jgi:hypothetical protein